MTRRFAPAALRNSGPIADALADELPARGTVLEVASGTGEHALHLARRFEHLQWQPSDVDDEALSSIAAWREMARLPNLLPPLRLDASAAEWPIAHADAVLCINMVHISPWSATESLFAHAAAILPAGGPLFLYGPFIEADVPTTPSNQQFDMSLRARDPAWGLRNVSAVDELAAQLGLARTARKAMPANNLTLIYRKR